MNVTNIHVGTAFATDILYTYYMYILLNKCWPTGKKYQERN